MLHYLLNRINETSSLRGVVLFIGGLTGWNVSESQAESVISVVLAIAGLIAAFFPDRFSGKSRKTDVADDDDDDDDDGMDAEYDPRDAFGRVQPPLSPGGPASPSLPERATPERATRRLEPDYGLDDTNTSDWKSGDR